MCLVGVRSMAFRIPVNQAEVAEVAKKNPCILCMENDEKQVFYIKKGHQYNEEENRTAVWRLTEITGKGAESSEKNIWHSSFVHDGIHAVRMRTVSGKHDYIGGG